MGIRGETLRRNKMKRVEMFRSQDDVMYAVAMASMEAQRKLNRLSNDEMYIVLITNINEYGMKTLEELHWVNDLERAYQQYTELNNLLSKK